MFCRITRFLSGTWTIAFVSLVFSRLVTVPGEDMCAAAVESAAEASLVTGVLTLAYTLIEVTRKPK